MDKTDFIVRFSGEGGQGMVTASEALAQAAAQVGYHVQTFVTFPSQIVGGPTWSQARICVTPVLSSGDELDVLVAFNRNAYDEHRGEVRGDGVILYDSDQFELENEPGVLGMPFEKLGKSTGNARAGNMVVLGALAQLVGWPEEYLSEFVKKRFTRGRDADDEIIRTNIEALGLGRNEAAKSAFSLGQLANPSPPAGKQALLRGNEALSLGAIAAGLEVFIGYPISPATTILVFMERNLADEGTFVYQASSEIESINAIIGAGYSGKRSMTSTAGPGLSLMSEGIGFAWMAEIPTVIVNVQRGGPATGLPTKTEQSDLLASLNPAHGDMRTPVIAPGTVAECFEAAVHALNWAERYQGPVILLTEAMLAERAQNIPMPDVSAVKVERRAVYHGANGYQRYGGPGMTPMPVPGGPGAYVANASEHDPLGDTTHLGDRHVEMTERRFAKLRLLEDGTYESDNAEESAVVLPWGGSKGPAREAYDELCNQGVNIGWYYTMFLHPMPPKMLEELRRKDLVIVPELNYLGQFSSILRSYGVKAESITQYTGLPFRKHDLAASIKKRLAAGKKEGITV